jgi:hypothetical protein
LEIPTKSVAKWIETNRDDFRKAIRVDLDGHGKRIA